VASTAALLVFTELLLEIMIWFWFLKQSSLLVIVFNELLVLEKKILDRLILLVESIGSSS